MDRSSTQDTDDRHTSDAGFERLYRPEYTGENRCLPCTVLNLVIVGFVGLVAWRRNRLLGVLTTTVGLTLVALRGYVVPGTPWLGPRLVELLPFDVGHPEASGSLSDHEDDSNEAADAAPGVPDAPTDSVDGSLAPADDPEQLLAALAEAGVVEVTESDVYLAEEFEQAWVERMERARENSLEELAFRAADAARESVEGSVHNGRILLAGERDVWLKPAVAVAETTAAELLAEWGVPDGVRQAGAKPLRTLLPCCPSCGGPVEETTFQNCCGGPGSVQRSPERPVLACGDCETVLFVFE